VRIWLIEALLGAGIAAIVVMGLGAGYQELIFVYQGF
jgi:hypothetical protein